MTAAKDFAMKLASALCLAAALAAAPAFAAEPVFSPARSPGGIAFWYRLRSDVPSVAIVAGWPDGSGVATPGKEGLPALARAAMEEGAGERDANEFGEALEDASASISLHGDDWTVTAALQCPPEKLADAAALEADMLNSPRLEQKEIDRARKALGGNMRQSQTRAEAIAALAAARYVYGDSPMLRTLDPAAMDGVTREDILGWRKRVLTRRGLVVAASGPLAAEDFGKAVDTLFSGLPETSDLPAAVRPEPRFAAKTILVEKELAQTVLHVVADTAVKQDRTLLQPALAVNVLGGGFESRIVANVRQKQGASYGVSARLTGMPAHQLLTISGAVANDKTGAALAAIVEEYALWQRAGITADEFDAARKRLAAAFDGEAVRPGNDAATFVSVMLAGRPANDSADYAARLASYTPESANKEVAAKFTPPPLLTVIVGPRPEGVKVDCVIKDWREAEGCR